MLEDGNFPSYVHADLQRHFTSVVLAAMLNKTPPAWTKSLMRIWLLILQPFEPPANAHPLTGPMPKVFGALSSPLKVAASSTEYSEARCCDPRRLSKIKENSMWFWFSRTSDRFDGTRTVVLSSRAYRITFHLFLPESNRPREIRTQIHCDSHSSVQSQPPYSPRTHLRPSYHQSRPTPPPL